MRSYHILLAIFIAAIWGSNFIFIKLGLSEIPPFLLCTLRFMLVSIPLIFFIPKPNIPFIQVIYYGLSAFAMQFGFLFLGMTADMPAGLSSLIFQIQIFINLFLAALFLNEKPTSLQLIGAIISFIGLGMIWSNMNHRTSWLGFVLEICGAASWAIGNLITKKIGHVNPLSLVTWGCVVSIPPVFLLSLILEGPSQIITSLHHLSWLGVMSIAFIAYGSTLIGYALWNRLVGIYPIAYVVPFTLLVPVFGMIGSYLVFAEPITEPWKLGAACLIILGLSINVFGARFLSYIQRKSTKQSEPAV